MKLQKMNVVATVAIILSLTLISCDDDDGIASPSPKGSSTFEIIAESENHNTLETLLKDTGLDQALNSDAIRTVFAPTDAAFNNVDLNGLTDAEKTNILLNHVVEGEFFAVAPGVSQASTISTGYVKTLATEKITENENNLDLYISVGDQVTLNGTSTVTGADLNANNGVVHVVDEVITLPDVTTFATADPTFDNLEAALTRGDLQTNFVDILSNPNGTGNAPFTVFAPTNDAFADLLENQGFADLAAVPQALLESALKSHVISGDNVRAADLTNDTVPTLDANLTIDAENATLTDPNGRESNIIVTDVQTANGVIHAIDKVVLPARSTFDVIADSPNHTTLEQALVTTGLDQVLSGDNFTVFAPTDAAFGNADVNVNGLSNAELTNVLLNHVLTGTTLSSDLSSSYVKTNATETITGDANPLDLYINLDSGVTLNGAADVSNPDIKATNGVVHVTDAVIPMPDITTFATADPTFDSLEAALTRGDQPDFVGTLSTPNGTAPAPFTVFAPTNNAFTALLSELELADLTEIPQQTLTRTLNSHVVAGDNLRATDLTDGTVTTLGADLTVAIDPGTATLTDPNGRISNIIVTDVQTTNGVIHAIDTVVLPLQ